MVRSFENCHLQGVSRKVILSKQLFRHKNLGQHVQNCFRMQEKGEHFTKIAKFTQKLENLRVQWMLENHQKQHFFIHRSNLQKVVSKNAKTPSWQILTFKWTTYKPGHGRRYWVQGDVLAPHWNWKTISGVFRGWAGGW